MFAKCLYPDVCSVKTSLHTDTLPGRIHQWLLRLIQLRQQNPAFIGTETELTETRNNHVFSFLRSHEDHAVFVLGNFSEQEQRVEARRLRQMGMRKIMVDLNAGQTITAAQELILAPYQLMVLARVG